MPARRLSTARAGRFARAGRGTRCARRARRLARVLDVGALGGAGRGPLGFGRERCAMNYFAPHALLPDGWATAVALDIDQAGTIVSVTPASDADGREVLAGPVVPAMPNLHSHAFQRALAGRTGR